MLNLRGSDERPDGMGRDRLSRRSVGPIDHGPGLGWRGRGSSALRCNALVGQPLAATDAGECTPMSAGLARLVNVDRVECVDRARDHLAVALGSIG